MFSLLKKKPQGKVLLYLIFFLILIIGGFLYLKSRSLTKTVLKKTFAKNIQFEETISLEKVDQKDKYQPTLNLKFAKPKGQKVTTSLRFTLIIPKEFAQSTEQLSFSIPPTQIIQKDPIVVWGFDNPIGDKICDIYVDPPEDVQTEDGLVCYDISKIDIDKREVFGDWLTLGEREKYSRLSPSEREKRMAELIDIFQKNYPEIEKKYSEKIVREYKAELEKLKAEIIKWLAGQINSLIITIKREPMDYQSGKKVCTETVQMLVKQQPSSGKNEVASYPTPRIVPTEGPYAKIYLGDKLLLDPEKEAGGCSWVGNILYSPTKEYFLVVLGCIEGDDQAFLFKADGSDKKEVTAKWDVVNYGNVKWEPDGKSFIYERINSCCVEPERFGEKGPPVGMVKYDIATGEKTVVGPLPNYKP